jgi:hypothetical protein
MKGPEKEKKDNTRQTTLLGMMGKKSKAAPSDENLPEETQMIESQSCEMETQEMILDIPQEDSQDEIQRQFT